MSVASTVTSDSDFEIEEPKRKVARSNKRISATGNVDPENSPEPAPKKRGGRSSTARRTRSSFAQEVETVTEMVVEQPEIIVETAEEIVEAPPPEKSPAPAVRRARGPRPMAKTREARVSPPRSSPRAEPPPVPALPEVFIDAVENNSDIDDDDTADIIASYTEHSQEHSAEHLVEQPDVMATPPLIPRMSSARKVTPVRVLEDDTANESEKKSVRGPRVLHSDIGRALSVRENSSSPARAAARKPATHKQPELDLEPVTDAKLWEELAADPSEVAAHMNKTVEEWVMYLADTGERALMARCEKMLAALEREGQNAILRLQQVI